MIQSLLFEMIICVVIVIPNGNLTSVLSLLILSISLWMTCEERYTISYTEMYLLIFLNCHAFSESEQK